MFEITIPKQKVPVIHKTEVLVLGGGPAGMAAAVSATKNGSDVTLLERYGFLGGQSTGGLVIILCGLNDKNKRIIKGYCQEVIDYLETFQAAKPWLGFYVFDPETLKRCFDEHIINNNIKLYLHTLVVDTIVEDKNINYVIIETKNGRQAIEASVIIDCTGDGDTLKWTGEHFEMAKKEDLRQVTACFRLGGVNVEKARDYIKLNREEFTDIFNIYGPLINPNHWVDLLQTGQVWFDMSHINNIDITDVEDLTKAEIQTRKLSWDLYETFKTKVSGFDQSYIIDIAPLLGIRDSRRLKGKHFITEADYGKTFDDNICYIPYYYAKEGTDKLQVPYRSLLPKTTKNLITAGRCISIEHKLIDCMREIAQCFATGQAAGLAASIATQDKVRPGKIDITKLQTLLRKQGAYL